jgi:hypothetical protein
MRRWSTIVVIVGASFACNGDSSPTAPTTSTSNSLALQAGPYSLFFLGADGVSGPSGSIPGCPGLGTSGIGNTVFTTVFLQPEGSDWVGRATDGTSTLVVRLRRGEGPPQPPRTGTRVVGEIEGAARNTFSASGSVDDVARTVSFGVADANALEGAVPPTVNALSGVVIGATTLTGANGASVSCNSGTLSWSMSGPLR